MKQAEPVGGTVPPSIVAPVVEVGHVVGVAEVAPGAPFSILAKRKLDDGVGVSGCKNFLAFVN